MNSFHVFKKYLTLEEMFQSIQIIAVFICQVLQLADPGGGDRPAYWTRVWLPLQSHPNCLCEFKKYSKSAEMGQDMQITAEFIFRVRYLAEPGVGN
jgi:hypothetical protein